jgi:formylmethanofuran dehydrogenase subunit E-like metal-binding protein
MFVYICIYMYMQNKNPSTSCLICLSYVVAWAKQTIRDATEQSRVGTSLWQVWFVCSLTKHLKLFQQLRSTPIEHGILPSIM